MPRREKMLLCAGAVFLVLLFLMSSTDLIIKERAVQIDSISVILSEDTDDIIRISEKEWKRQLQICEVM